MNKVVMSDEESSADESFRNVVLSETGLATHKEAMKMRSRNSDMNWLLAGENILKEEKNVGYMSPIGKLSGRVIVTNYQLRFESKEHTARSTTKTCVVSVPLGTISRVEKVGYSTVSRGEDSYGLEIVCKDMRTIRFTSQQANHSRRQLFEYLQKHAFPITNKLPFFAFSYDQKFSFNGWNLFDTIAEYQRMGVPNDTWTITKINDRYEYSDAYPAILSIPMSAEKEGEDFLWRVGGFRSKQRIPVLSWLHPKTQASLTRASQPMVGMTARKSADDERYLQMIIEANAQSDKLFIFDARPEVNAKVNKAKGGGFENEDAYANCQLIFLDIGNIHVMRESLRKLKDICYPRVDNKSWYSNLNETRWLEHIKMIMFGCRGIVDKIENGKSVLVHCSDGWDRTAQLTSLAMIQLDAYYRTMRGFAVLIEKEWCSFGHKFAHRIGHGEDKAGDQERSPIFLQFIDCVWQLTQQFKTSFEFNTNYLIALLDELYSCRFGTFLCNSEKQRHRDQVKEKTVSLWSYMESNRRHFTNALYNEDESRCGVLQPNCTMHRLQLWNDYYLRYNASAYSTERLDRDAVLLVDQMVHLRDALRLQLDQQRMIALKNTTVTVTASAI